MRPDVIKRLQAMPSTHPRVSLSFDVAWLGSPEITPTFAVREQLDVWYWPNLDLFGRDWCPGTPRRSYRQRGHRQHSRLRRRCYAYDSEQQIGRVLVPIPAEARRVFSITRPTSSRRSPSGVQTCTARAMIHNGQIALPRWYGALSHAFQNTASSTRAGYTTWEGSWLYVNQGIGMEGGRMPRVRFCSRPEVTVIEIHPLDHESH